MVSIPLSGDEEGYSFSGNGMGENTLTSFRYEGRVTKGQLTLNISNLQMGNAELWANTYKLSDVINGPKNILEQDWSAFPDTKFHWVEQDGQLLNAPCYLNLKLEANRKWIKCSDVGRIYSKRTWVYFTSISTQYNFRKRWKYFSLLFKYPTC